MRKISKPTVTVKTVFIDCISIVRNKKLKEDLTNCINLLEEAELDFEEKIKKNEIHKIPQILNISECIDKDIMEKVYTDRMAKKDKPGRSHYDLLFSLAPSGKCPLCSLRVVMTLDHYLPKTKFPIFSVTPINLIPSCTDCNKGKLNDYPTTSEEETLHPYFDNIEDENWLKAKIIATDPIGFEYYVEPSEKWSKLLNDRVSNHFKSFELNSLYCIHAIEEFQSIKPQLINLYNNGGKDLLQKHLQDCYESRKLFNLNSWQAAFYNALLNDECFCSGGVIS